MDPPDIPASTGLPPRLELVSIGRRFGATIANEDVSLAVRPGEIHALLGENGAGKSTLVRIIYGLLRPDTGTMFWDGAPVLVDSPLAARRLGISMVSQHFALFEAMTVLENVALGMDCPGPLKLLGARIRQVSAAYGLPLDPAREVHTLSVGERQRIEIVRCLLQAPRLIIMDEPTSVLTPQEAAQLFQTLRRLAAEGCSILYISHKLEEIRALCHRATVLREGRVVGRCDPRAESVAALAALMLGGSLKNPARPRRDQADPPLPACRLSLEQVDVPADTLHGVSLKQLTLQVRAGEIVGIAGVAGNGQNELFAVLSGERLTPLAGDVQLDGRPAGHAGPAERRRRGLSSVPEDRRGHGAVPALSLAENAFLTAHGRLNLARGGWIGRGKARRFAATIVERFGVRCFGVEAPAATLSGGNLQKFIVGREILQDPGVIVVSQPTWGVDAGAAAIIHRALAALAAGGAAVLLISQDLDELLAVSDRLAVLNEGRLSPLRPTAAVTLEALGLLMGGVHGAAPPTVLEGADAA